MFEVAEALLKVELVQFLVRGMITFEGADLLRRMQCLLAVLKVEGVEMVQYLVQGM